MKKLIILFAVIMLMQMTAFATPLNGECIFDGKDVVIKGVRPTGNNDEFSIVVTTPDGRKLMFQKTGNNDGTFEFSIAVPEDEVSGEYLITLDTAGADAPAVMGFVKNSGAVRDDAFIDMNEASWAADAMRYMKKNGYAQGDGNGRYRPNDNVSCAELIKLALSAVAGETHTENSANWSEEWIASAREKGIVDKVFGGCDMDTPAQRQQAAAVIYELIANKANDVQGMEFSDNDAVSEYAKDGVAYLSGIGIINGMPDGGFAPEGNLTRAEIAQMLYKLN